MTGEEYTATKTEETREEGTLDLQGRAAEMAATLLSHFYRNAKIRNRKFFTKGCIKITHWWFL